MDPRIRTRLTASVWLLVLCALAPVLPIWAQETAPRDDADQGQPSLDRTAQAADETAEAGPPAARRSPRATMATFLNAIEEAEHGQVERYLDALACLDLSGLAELPAEARGSRARKLASLLNEFIDRHGVELGLIPDDPAGDAHTYYTSDDGRTISIRRYAERGWLFTWASLAFVEHPPQEAAADQATPRADQSPPPEHTEPEPTKAGPAPEVPAGYRSARATMRTFRDAMKEGRVGDAAKCLDLSDIPLTIRGEKGGDLADYLHQAMVRTREVVLQEVPDDPQARPHILRQDDLGIMVLARQVEDDAHPGYWLFTKETVAGIESLYDALLAAGEEVKGEQQETAAPFRPSRWLREHVPESLKRTWFLLMHYQWLGLAATLVLGWMAHRIVAALLRLVAGLWLRQHHVTVDQGVQIKTFRPLGILAMAAAWWLGLTWLALPADVLAVLLLVVKFLACWAAVWTAYRAVDLLADYFASFAAQTNTKVDDMLVPFLRKVAKTVVTVLGVVFIVQQFTERTPVQLIAGLGLGGLALALAAQDPLKNLFGSLTVMLDRPFKVGDWVVVGEFDGTVESVGFRSTRIRTFYNSQVVVPNASLMNVTVDNYGARRFRRIKVMLSLTYSTPPEKIDAFCEGVRELIRLHPYTRKDYYHVYFNKFAVSSLDILLYCFLETPDWSTELRERHRLFVDILRLAHELGVEFAFPTQTLWLERARDAARQAELEPAMPGQAGRDDPDAIALHGAAKVFEEAHGKTPARRGPVVVETTPRSRQMRPGAGDTKGG